MKSTLTKAERIRTTSDRPEFLNRRTIIINLKQKRNDIVVRLELSINYGAPSMSKSQQEGVYERQIVGLSRSIATAEQTLTELENIL